MTDNKEEFNNISKNIVAIFEGKKDHKKEDNIISFNTEPTKLKKELKNVKNGFFNQPKTENISASELRDILNERRPARITPEQQEFLDEYIENLKKEKENPPPPTYKTKEEKELNEFYQSLIKEHKQLSDYLPFQDFMNSKIRDEKSKETPSLKLIEQYDSFIHWKFNDDIFEEWDRELLED